MSLKQSMKHDTARVINETKAILGTGSSLDAAEPTPDGLGTWEGGLAALKGSNRWVAEKSHATRTADAKNAPGTDYASKINKTHQKDYVAPLLIEESDNVPCDEEPSTEDYAHAVYFDADAIERNTVQELTDVKVFP